ncbi:Hypothetical predicted protein [Olea europaea subsp. europaea]|uniref:Uncharacterized protein n=1 Tax=Olea europaea subsp. europaea TaxID=158383 RepID=A0A8S0SDH3_OLEEU|nr:Hypothetical predicted protein [Olea europaea subsp. europaea]
MLQCVSSSSWYSQISNGWIELLRRLTLPRLYESLSAQQLDDTRLHRSSESNSSLASHVRRVAWQVQHLFYYNGPSDQEYHLSLPAFREKLDSQLDFLARCKWINTLKICNKELYHGPSDRAFDTTLPLTPYEFAFPWPSLFDIQRLPFINQLKSFSLRLEYTDDPEFDHQPMHSLVHHFISGNAINSVYLNTGVHSNGKAMFGHEILPTITELEIDEPKDFQFLRLCPNLAKLSARRALDTAVRPLADLLEPILLPELNRLELSGCFESNFDKGRPSNLASTCPTLAHMVLIIDDFDDEGHKGSAFSMHLDTLFSTTTPFLQLRDLHIEISACPYFGVFSYDQPPSSLLRRFSSRSHFPNLRNLKLESSISAYQDVVDDSFRLHYFDKHHWPLDCFKSLSFEIITRCWEMDIQRFLQSAPTDLYILQTIHCGGDHSSSACAELTQYKVMAELKR